MKSAPELHFRHCRLDPANQLLYRGFHVIPLRQKSLAVLQYLVEHPGQLVTKEELLRTVWSGTCVSDTVLRVCIRELRHALKDRKRTPQFIETVHGRGFRFIAPVITSQPVQSPRSKVKSPQSAFPNPHSAINLVGREAELTQLHQWLGKAVRGKRQIVFVTGEPGIGKTALVEAFLERLETRDWRLDPAPQASSLKTQDSSVWIARGQCVAHYGAGEAYLPILEALKRLCREPGREHFVTLFRQFAPTWLLQMPSLLDPTSRKNLQREILGATRERMLRELTELVEALTAEALLVLVLEDLHWSDYSTLDFLSHLAWRQEPARLLLIATYRPVEMITNRHPLKTVKQELQTHDRCEDLSLGLLSEAAVAEYLAARFAVGAHTGSALRSPDTAAGRAPLQRLAHIVHQRTDGNPLFMVDVVNDLFAQGFIVQADREWRIQGDLEVVKRTIPKNLRQLIEQQLDRLSKEEQQVLEAASVAGMEFSAAAVAAGLEIETIQAEERCEELARRQQFLQSRGVNEWPDGTVATRYGLIHALYQNVLYERITAGKRAQLHQQIGEREEKGYSDRVQEIAGELAVHFERGRDYRRVVQYLRQAAENAMQRGGRREATGHLTKGLELLKALPDTPERRQQELVLQTRLGLALQGYRGLASPEAERAYVRAGELCQQVGEPVQLFHLLQGLVGIYYTRGELQKAHELAEQCLGLAEQLQDSALLIAAHAMLGTILSVLGELAPARIHFEQGIALYDPQQYPPLAGGSPSFATYYVMYCLSFGTRILSGLGYPDQALKRTREALTLAQEQPHPYGLTWVTLLASEIYLLRREWRLAQEQAEAVISLATKYGFIQWGSMATILRGAAVAEQGKVEEGISQIRQGLVAYQATGAEVRQASYLALLARAYWKAERSDEGLTILDEALAAARKNGQRLQDAWLHWLKGELTLQKLQVENSRVGIAHHNVTVAEAGTVGGAHPTGDEGVEACFLKAIEVARQQQAKWLELHAVMSLSRLWQSQGKKDEARQMLAETYGWFTEGFDTVDLKEAKALLEELAE